MPATLTADQLARIRSATHALLPACTSFLQSLVRIDTTNPPGLNYPQIAHLLGDKLLELGYEVTYYPVPEEEGRLLAPHGEGLERVNVLGRREFDQGKGKVLHFNGHTDVVPAPDPANWKSPPFEAQIHGDTIIGRGVSDMKGGLAAQLYAIEALARAGLRPRGTVEHSGVVDEETTGIRNAGMGWMVEQGIIAKGKQDAVIITEPLNVENVCLGHRGAIWGRITFRGVATHGSTPQRGVNALLHAALFVSAAHHDLSEKLKLRLDDRVVPPEARAASLTFTILHSGHATNLVPSSAVLHFDRRLVPSESLAQARAEISGVLDRLRKEHGDGFVWEYEELYSTEPVWVGEEEEIAGVMRGAIGSVVGVEAGVVCSPGSDDQRFVVNDAKLNSCVVYGPGNIRNVHNLNEELALEDLRVGMEVMAVAAASYLGVDEVKP